jgi:hypothetical protein
MRHYYGVQPAGIDLISELSDMHHHVRCFNDIHSRQTFHVRAKRNLTKACSVCNHRSAMTLQAQMGRPYKSCICYNCPWFESSEFTQQVQSFVKFTHQDSSSEGGFDLILYYNSLLKSSCLRMIVVVQAIKA